MSSPLVPDAPIEHQFLADVCTGNTSRLPWATHIRIFPDFSSVLLYLHGWHSRPCSILTELKPSNVILDKNYVSKISDFGMLRLLCADLNHKTHDSSHGVKFPVAASATEMSTGSHVTKYLSVHNPLSQMVFSARKKFHDKFTRFKSIVPDSIFDMAKRLCSSASSNMCEACWISAKPWSESPNNSRAYSTERSIGIRNKPTENESNHHSDHDSCRAEYGIKPAEEKISASWIAATAAPHHATGNRNLLSGFISEHNDQFIHAVDGVPMQVCARGAVVTDTIVLPDVWFVPGLTTNLVSVSQLAELDYSVGFGGSECSIRSGTYGNIVGKAHLREGGLYVLDFLEVPLAM